MITHIRMRNFKPWRDSGKVSLTPLTGFFGINSSGKSSLLQMLLLLKQTAEHSNTEEPIFFGNETSPINLGDFQEVIHKHNRKTSLELEFGCKLQNSLIIKLPPRYYPEVNVDGFTFNTSIREEKRKSKVNYICYTVGTQTDTEIKWQGNSISYRDARSQDDNYRSGGNEIKNCHGTLLSGPDKAFPALSTAFENLFTRVYHLGPTRADPRRSYAWSGVHPKDINRRGDQTIDALLSARVRQLKTLQKEEMVPIEDRISKWLQEMELAHSFSLNWANQSTTEYETRIQKSQASPIVNLVDMGYGLGQFLPVLFLCYYAPEGSTLILEHPSIHLHPKVQSQLADLLIEVVTERKLQILVESHSEHLLNRLQRRVAEEKIAADQTALYFCRNDEGVSNIERLKMDEYGNITNWPENFFGDEMGDLFAMTKAQRERQKKAEG